MKQAQETIIIDLFNAEDNALINRNQKTLIYCDYKTFSLETLSSELFSKLESQENNDYQIFEKNFVDTLNNQAPKKIQNLSS